MKMTSISHTKNNLSALLDLVRNGETIIITDRNKPIARLEPIFQGEHIDDEGRLARLERAGIIKRAGKNVSSRSISSIPLPELPRGVSALDALLANREEER